MPFHIKHRPVCRHAFVFGSLVFAAAGLSAQSPDLTASVQKQFPALTETYIHLHRNPEFSHHEEKTSAYLAGELRKAGYTVTEHVGKYPDGSQAWGIVAMLENGAGPRLLIRTDMDALPVEEKTGLEYASTVRSTNAQGQPVGVMHACGHDIHMTVLLGTAREMAARKDKWHGTLVLIGQPSEETIDGARAMLADGLYQRFGTPDFILSAHDIESEPAGSISIKGGPLLASSNSIDVTMRGIGVPRLGSAERQRPSADGGRIHRAGPDHREPPDRSAAAGRAYCRHDSRRSQAQHHSRRSRSWGSRCAPTPTRCAIRSSQISAAPPMESRPDTAFQPIACRS